MARKPIKPEPFPLLPPKQAIDFFRAKGMKIGFAWQDVWQEEHAHAFTVAKAMQRDILETIRAAVDDAIANGRSLAQFRAELTPLLQAKGWWGRKMMIDPATGQMRSVELGSPRRLKIIYDMNLRMAHAAGRWVKIQRTKDSFPFLRYTAVMDDRTRPEHAGWHGTILPVDDPWWDTHYPPCGWNCRCTVMQLDQAMMDERGWQHGHNGGPPLEDAIVTYTNPRTGEVSELPAGIDPGFAYNVGKAALDGLAPPPLLPPELPALEPGVAPGAPVPGAPSPASLLAEGVGEREAVEAFVQGAGAAPAGSVILDPAGWPQPISPGWFRGIDGKTVVPEGDHRRVLGLVGRAIAAPTEIRLRWVKGADGSPMLFRRYIAKVDGLLTVVDIGRAGWRYATERDPGFDLARLAAGTLVWSSTE